MFITLGQITGWLANYGYFALFPLVVVEGPIITVAAGFLSSLGAMNFFITYLVVAAGDLGGDVVHYSLGRFGGRKFIDKWGRFFGVNPAQLAKLEQQFAKNGRRLLFIGKVLHGAGGAFLIAAGIIKMPFREFFFANFFATLIKSFLLLLLGFYFGHALAAIDGFLEKIALISLGATLLAMLIYIFYIRKTDANN